ncbi:esterase-like activity of phytase family protein [Massilia endophytica]|uniref:esterase-like activity of phytase family protein n=1 Tax=Massilia endophytica TaxID=2899220 RepID=UPI001E53258F|nr:esterase-like activity of phytase family protein [Massilia endophytica]UGQ49069.1 esterase-like activity of phytase family protein [Massilia endophytica]
MKSFTALAGAVCLASLLAGCAAPGATDPAHRVGSLRFIGEQRIPLKQQFGGTTVGGLSGFDYDASTGSWIIASDDRSIINPSRFYKAELRFGAASFDAVTITGSGFFRQEDGSTYPDAKDNIHHQTVADIEAVRIDPQDGTVWYASEGDRRLIQEPFLRQAKPDGSFIREIQLPAMFLAGPGQEHGARTNLSFEGLSFAPDGRSLWLAMEAPLYQDGPVPTPEHGGLSRITQMDRSGRVLAQYVYPIEAIPDRPGLGKAADNGVSEIVANGAHSVLVLERSAVQAASGKYRNYVRLYEMDVRSATDVQHMDSLQGARFTPAAKRLVLDFDTLRLPVLDNVEGFSFGPKLPNGHDTLVFVSDDNFSARQVTQFLLFEVIP